MPAGRPTDLTPDLQAAFVATLRRCWYLEAAADLIGVHRATVYRSLNRGRRERKGLYAEFRGLERDVARRQEGMTSPHAEHNRRPLAEHLTDWETALLAEGATPKPVRQTVACLRPESFDLDAEPPVAVLGAAETKNRKGATQPLPPDGATALHDYMAGRPTGAPLWPGNWWENAADMLRIDLDAAGVPYVTEGPDGPLYADFHSRRHNFIALLEKSGATLKEAMQLARHSDPKLTMAVYGGAQLHDLGRRETAP
jgi:hypothetical protein